MLNNMIGEEISEVLVDIEDTLWEFEGYSGAKPNYTMNGFRAALKIFMSAVMDKMWELQEDENMNTDDRENMANKAGEDIKTFISTYTNIDTHKLYK